MKIHWPVRGIFFTFVKYTYSRFLITSNFRIIFRQDRCSLKGGCLALVWPMNKSNKNQDPILLNIELTIQRARLATIIDENHHVVNSSEFFKVHSRNMCIHFHFKFLLKEAYDMVNIFLEIYYCETLADNVLWSNSAFTERFFRNF